MMHGQQLRRNGFTLVELLVALFVFSLISAAGVALLRGSADGQIALKARLNDHSAVTRTAGLIESDLAQLVPRPVRDIAGIQQPAFINRADQSAQAGQPLFTFTRAGLSGGDNQGSSGIGRIGYYFADGALRRTSRAAADGAAAAPGVILLDKLQSVTIRFRGENGQWISNWAAIDPLEIPRAIELTVKPLQRPSFRLLMLVGPQLRPADPPPANDQAG